MTTRYPIAFAGISTWAADNNVSVAEARTRFAQYGILRAVADSRTLSAILVFKGGNALDFVWQPNRSTRDLDFSADLRPDQPPLTADVLKDLLERTLGATGRVLGIAFVLHRVTQQPPGPDKTFITYEARIGYALPDETALRTRMARGLPSPQVIPLEVSLNEPICASE